MEGDSERIYFVAWGRDRAQVEAYLYGGNEILLEYESPGHNPYFAIVKCSAGGGFGVESQLARLASGSQAGGEPKTLEEAEREVFELFGATPVLQDVDQPGNRSRPSALAERSPDPTL